MADTFQYRGEADLPNLEQWLSDIGANTFSFPSGKKLNVGHQYYTAGGNPKKYEWRGRIITPSEDDTYALYSRLEKYVTRYGFSGLSTEKANG